MAQAIDDPKIEKLKPDAKDDLKSLPLPQMEKKLASSPEGLSQDEAAKRLIQYGQNAVAVEKLHPLRDLMSKFWGAIPWMLEAAVVLELILHKWVEAAVIGGLLLFNAVLSLMQEHQAQKAVALLRTRLTIQVRVRRDKEWKTVPAGDLVPGDIIHLGMGDFVAADIRLMDGTVLVDLSAITGESKPLEAGAGAEAFMGSLIKRGEGTGMVIATGSRSSYGKTAEIVQTAGAKGHLQEMIFGIVRSLILVDAALVAVLLAYAYFTHLPLRDMVPFCLILLVASVPAALPAVFTLAAALGTQELAKRGVLVSRLAAIEDAAAMDVLATDKTGTLTKNELSLSSVSAFPTRTEEETLRFALLASDEATKDPIDLAILTAAHDRKIETTGFERRKFIPFDPATKQSEATVQHGTDTLRVVKGAPAAIAALTSDKNPSWLKDADALAAKGFRVLAVAAGPEKSSEPVGLVALLDAPRDDASALVKSLHDLGLRVIMITGDGPATAMTVAAQVGITGSLCPPERLHSDLAAAAEDCGIFAGIFPEDKIHLVEALQKSGHVVGMTGDGVNDAPALKQAEVGIAIASATDVAKAAASAVLTNPGLGEVVAAVETSRRIYQRMLTYTLNKIIKTLEICLFLTLGVLLTHSLVITPVLMILLLFTNDFGTMSLATDHVSFSKRPERWDVRSLVMTAIPLAALSLLLSLSVLMTGKFLLHLTPRQVQTLVFLTLVFGGQGMVYLVRERSHLWRSRPSAWLLASSAAAVTAVSVLAVLGLLMAPLPPALVGGLLIVTLLYLLGVDFLKIFIFRRFGVHSASAPPASAAAKPS